MTHTFLTVFEASDYDRYADVFVSVIPVGLTTGKKTFTF